MLFHILLLAALLWHATFCVAQAPERFRTSLFLKYNKGFWATVVIRDSQRRIQNIQTTINHHDDIKCEALQSRKILKDIVPNPGVCKVQASCERDDGTLIWLLCIGRPISPEIGRRLHYCREKSEDHEKKLESIEYCDEDFRPSSRAYEVVSDVAIVIRDLNNKRITKQLTLFIPQPPATSRSYEITKIIWAGHPESKLPCAELSTASLEVDPEQRSPCALQVWCLDQDNVVDGTTGQEAELNNHRWIDCLAYFQTRRSTSGLFGQCGVTVSKDTPKCFLGTSFKDA